MAPEVLVDALISRFALLSLVLSGDGLFVLTRGHGTVVGRAKGILGLVMTVDTECHP